MGFGLKYQIIEDKPVLIEVLHKTSNGCISIIISSDTGDKLKAIEYDIHKLDTNLSHYAIELPSESMKAVIPIKIGDYITACRLYNDTNTLEFSCCKILFIEDGWASGPDRYITVDRFNHEINGFIECSNSKANYDIINKHKYSDYTSPALLLCMFNVINPHNAVSYHLVP